MQVSILLARLNVENIALFEDDPKCFDQQKEVICMPTLGMQITSFAGFLNSQPKHACQPKHFRAGVDIVVGDHRFSGLLK